MTIFFYSPKQLTMKKVAYFLAFVIIALTSCQKNDTEAVQPENSTTPNLQIYFGDQNLKNGGIGITPNDTIDLYRNLPTVFWAHENNEPVKVSWEVQQTLSDDPPHVFSMYHQTFEDIMAYKPTDAGYYQFNIAEYLGGPTILTFWAYVATPQPGKIGDMFQNDYIFRMEKKFYPDGQEKLFIYFKYSENFSQQEVGAFLSGWPPGGSISIELTKYPFAKTFYSDDPYFYFILDIPEGMSNYTANINYWAYIEGVARVAPNTFFSSWCNNVGGIQFMVN